MLCVAGTQSYFDFCYLGWLYAHKASSYYLSKQQSIQLSWGTARLWCKKMGGHSDLVKIETKDENDYLFRIVTEGGISSNWIGATDTAEEGTFRWVDGSLLGYSNWGRYEPNNAGGEHCVHLNFKGTWNDYPCGWLQHFICERKS